MLCVIQVCFAQTAALDGVCAEGWATGEETYGLSEWRSRRKLCSQYNIATDRKFRECNIFRCEVHESDALAPTKPIQSASLEPSWPKIAPNIGLLWFFVGLGGSILEVEDATNMDPEIKTFSGIPRNTVSYDRRSQKAPRRGSKTSLAWSLLWNLKKLQNRTPACTRT